MLIDEDVNYFRQVLDHLRSSQLSLAGAGAV